jgi:hypothetical protein
LQQAQPQLLEIALATGAPRVFPGSRKNGKENRSQQSDNRDYNEQLNQREAAMINTFIKVTRLPELRTTEV